jgi:hypothetical protein
MPFTDKEKMRAYAKRWRKKHPTYMRDYGKRYYQLFEKAKRQARGRLPPIENSAVDNDAQLHQPSEA